MSQIEAGSLSQFLRETDLQQLLNEGYFFGGHSIFNEGHEKPVCVIESIEGNQNCGTIQNALSRAAFVGNTVIVEECLSKGASAVLQDEGGRTALHAAATGTSISTTRLILQSVKQEELLSFINKRDHKGWTALHIAVCRGNSEAVEILLKHGADHRLDLGHHLAPCRVSPSHSACIHFAALKPNLRIFRALLNAGAKITDRDNMGLLPLHYAVCHIKDAPTFVKTLIELDASTVMAEDMFGRTPLHCATARGLKNNCVLLLQYGAKISIKDHWDLSPLDYAVLNNQKETIALLEAFNKDEKKEPDSKNSLDERVMSLLILELKENNTDQLWRTVKRLGCVMCLEILERTIKILEAGGQITSDGHRERTPGGIFFNLVKGMVGDRISIDDWMYIIHTTKEKEKTRKRQQMKTFQQHLRQRAA